MVGVADFTVTDPAEESIDSGVRGGERVLPLAPLLFGVGGGLNAIYSIGQAVDSYRYWNDYYRNTHVKPRYPFRAGQYDWLADTGHSMYTTAYWFKR